MRQIVGGFLASALLGAIMATVILAALDWYIGIGG